ncbi:MAG: chemotaxis protein CheA [Thermodesulfobacteriota bacterium]|nr:chemotaxis protein CheA [Thermodesulfobacteriota bacterium]
MPDLLEKIENKLEAIALEVVTLEGKDIPGIGNILNYLLSLEEDFRKIEQPSFLDVTYALKDYLKKVILSEINDLEPVESGINYLQSACRSYSKGEEFQGEMSLILEKLVAGKSGRRGDEPENIKTGADEGDMIDEADEEKEFESVDRELTNDDSEILRDFVMESLENLGTIEVKLMDLEQDPNNIETINAIFRPFHTIKGVSGFVNLNKINKVAHSAENLLDKARDGEIRVEGAIVDVILESVDVLKKMIMSVQEGLERGILFENGMNIIPLINRIEHVICQADQIGEKPLGEILVKKGVLQTDDLEKGLDRQRIEPDKKIGEILLEESKVESKDVISALREQKKFNKQHIDLQVKVDTKKLDNLVDLTGELVIAQSMLKQNKWILAGNDQELYHNLNQLNQITTSLQRTAMSMRMIPIKNTFQKMVRLVRDLSKNSGKEVRLLMSGEDTEIDRNVVEELYEPMVHMIRNAVDHGIENPDERKRIGKERAGTIHLQAYHRGGNIVIEIDDDGRGLDKERIVQKAKSSSLITDESKLTDTEIYNLIFEPGFSTAEKVTDVSGRGVGMDVVKKGIEKLRGRVEINSKPGYGSTFAIRLPLTLAIIEGMLVRVGRERYIIPALAIVESFRPERNQYSTVSDKGEMILSRGNLIPLVRLDCLFGVRGDFKNPWEGLVVVVEHENGRICLLLDELLGKEEVVIKSLGESMKNIMGITGGAIMGDGRVGLIMDIAGIFDLIRIHESSDTLHQSSDEYFLHATEVTPQ